MRVLLLTPLIIFLLLIVIMLAKLMSAGTSERNAPLVGKPLPPFTIPAALGNKQGINSADIKGNYILLNIFGSWCVTCQIEHPFLMKLKQNNTIEIYGINWRDKPEDLAKFIKEKGNPYTAIGNDFAGKTVVALGATGAPESLLVSPGGIVIYRYAGPLSEDIWHDKIMPLIARKK